MALVFNGVTIPDNSANALTFNGSDVTQVVFNGTTVWQQSLFLDTQTVTVGSSLSQYVNWRGYSASFGSISDGTSNLYGGATIERLANINNNSTSFQLQGNRANSGWTTMTIDGVDFQRADATYSYSSSANVTSWTWSPTTNPFGTTDGAEKIVTWT